jgi:hypothetical protein
VQDTLNYVTFLKKKHFSESFAFALSWSKREREKNKRISGYNENGTKHEGLIKPE